MPTRTSTVADTMRKRPRQARALMTMESMLDAAAHILGRQGWAGLTTNAVAETAGVSIGSLYQYFPNKLALIAALRQRHFDEVLVIIAAATDREATRERRIAALVDGMIRIHRRHPAAWRVLLEAGPHSVDTCEAHARFEAAWTSGYAAFVAINGEVPAAEVDMVTLVLSGALSGAIHEAARQGRLEAPALRSALLDLINGSLRLA